MTYHHTRPRERSVPALSRVSNTPRVRSGASPLTYLVFYSFLDALAFIMGVCLGAFALGRFMHWFIYH